MADNHFDLVLVWDNIGGAVRVNGGGKAAVTDPATGNPVTVVQNGASVTQVTADANGRVTFVAQQGQVKLTSGGLSANYISAEQATAGAANAAAAQDAQAAAESARDQAIAARDSTTSGLATKASQADLLSLTKRARTSTATFELRTHASPAYDYILVTIRSGGPLPGVIAKRFAFDYETAGTSGSAFKPSPREAPSSYLSRTGADIVSNGSGADLVTNVDEIYGAQIKDGVIYHQFAPPSGNTQTPKGEHAIGFRSDGSVKVYSSNWGDTASSMVADGVVNSFSFGPALVRNGTKQTIDGTGISGRKVVGANAAGDVFIVSIPGVTDSWGVTYQQCADLAAELGMTQAVALDGGGSAQTIVSGKTVHPTSDTGGERPTADAILAYARVIGLPTTKWYDLTPVNGFTAHTTPPQVRLKDGIVELRGAVINSTATTATTALTLPWWAKPATYQRFGATLSTTLAQFYDVDTSGNVIMTGSTTNPSPRWLSVVRFAGSFI